MKQQINFDQLKEFPRERLGNKYRYSTTLSIGQLIELLYQHATITIGCEERGGAYTGWSVKAIGFVEDHKQINDQPHYNLELVDALWDAVKDVFR